MKLRVIDFETTGTQDQPGSAICEVAYTDVLPGRVVTETKSMLVNPGHPIPPEMSAIHHIVDSDVAGKPGQDAVVPFLMHEIDDDDIFVAHNAAFERHFFPAPGHRWVCTYKAAYDFVLDAPSHSNQVLRYFLDLPVDRAFANHAHRAGADSHVTAHLLVHLLDKGMPLSRMIEVSARPVLLRTVPFKKYEGQRWEELDDGMLRWCRDTKDMSEDVVFTAQHHLDLRRERRSNPFGG